MGKAIVISVALILIAIIISLVIRYVMKEANRVGDLSLKQERELRRLSDDAALVMRSLGASFNIEETDVISDRSRNNIEEWLRRYDHYHQKEINA